MKAEEILKARWLDILFENRNKEYGAYAIRKNYDLRLTGAILAALCCSLAFFFFLRNAGTQKQARVFLAGTEYDLTPPPENKQPEKLPEPKPQQPIPRKTISYAVPDFQKNVQPQISSPDDNNDADISTINNPDGAPGGTATQPDVPATPAVATPQVVTAPAPVVNDAPLTIAEEMPSYPGGREQLIAFLQRELQDYVTEEGQAKKATVRFIIEKDGSISAVEIASGSDSDFNKRVVRTIQKMPRWKPGAQNGQKVKILYEFPIQLVPAEE